MTKVRERAERFTMFTTLLLVNIVPAFVYILPLRLLFYKQAVSFQFISLSLVLLYAILCLCYRGYVSKDDFYNTMLDETIQHCSVCEQFKPERTHHCSSCKRCIKKMDHHCHWLGRCINYDNHGHFIRFLTFMFLNAASIIFYNIYVVYEVLRYNTLILSSYQSITVIITTLVAILLFFVGISHLIRQLIMLTRNVTFLESLHCRHFGFLEEDSPYNISLRHNFEDVLGPLKYCYLGPPKGNGLSFKKKYDVQYWPKHFKFSEKLYVEHL